MTTPIRVNASALIEELSQGSAISRTLAEQVKQLTQANFSPVITISIETDDDFLIDGQRVYNWSKDFPINDSLEVSLKNALNSLNITAVRGQEKSLAYFFQDIAKYVNARRLQKQKRIAFGGNQTFEVVLYQPATTVKILDIEVDLLK